jgi:hypothetical protein
MKGLVSVVLVLAGCRQILGIEDLSSAGGDGPGAVDGATADGAVGDGPASPADARLIDARPAACSPTTGPACSNCRDDDDDGLVDTADPECTTPNDNREDSYAKDIPGELNPDPCEPECMFDENAGSGDDGCATSYSRTCDPVACDLYESEHACGGCTIGTPTCSAGPPPSCVANCLPLLPNGCDCYGCCQVYVAGNMVTIILEPTCDYDATGDTTACPRCLINPTCQNTCEPCESCIGRGPVGSCPGGDGGCGVGEEACDPTLNDCPVGKWCRTGCCTAWP